jgi:hypothetical protein
VYLALHPTHISCALLEKPENAPLELRAYTKITHASAHPPLPAIQQELKNFLALNAAQNSFVHCAIMPPIAHEQCVILSDASATIADFIKPELRALQWQHTYLHPLEDGNHHYYVCALESQSLLYYQLLTLNAGLHAQRISTAYLALLNTYKYLYKSAFRHAQLARDMAQTNYNLEALFTADTTARLLTISPRVSISLEQERSSLLALIGLWYMKEQQL